MNICMSILCSRVNFRAQMTYSLDNLGSKRPLCFSRSPPAQSSAGFEVARLAHRSAGLRGVAGEQSARETGKQGKTPLPFRGGKGTARFHDTVGVPAPSPSPSLSELNPLLAVLGHPLLHARSGRSPAGNQFRCLRAQTAV